MTSRPNLSLHTDLLTEVTETADSLVLAHRYRDALANWMYIPLMLAFLMATLVSVAITIEVAKLGNELFYLLSAPAWLLWLLLGYLLLNLLFGSQTLMVRGEEICHEFCLFGWRARKQFLRSEIRSVACFYGMTPTSEIAGAIHHSVVIQTNSIRLRFGWMLAFEEAKCLIEKIVQSLRSDKTDANVFLRSDALVFEYVAVEPQVANNTVGYFLLEDDGESLTLRRKEKFSAEALIGVLLFNGVWDFFVVSMAGPLFGFGNAGGFAKLLNGPGWWLYVIFLIPFAGFSLLLFVALLKTISNAFKRTTWTIRKNEIERLDRWPILSRNDRFELMSDVKMVPIENHRVGWLAKMIDFKAMDRSSRHFELTLQNRDGAIICSIPKMTLDDALSLKNEIIKRRPNLFPLDPVATDFCGN